MLTITEELCVSQLIYLEMLANFPNRLPSLFHTELTYLFTDLSTVFDKLGLISSQAAHCDLAATVLLLKKANSASIC